VLWKKAEAGPFESEQAPEIYHGIFDVVAFVATADGEVGAVLADSGVALLKFEGGQGARCNLCWVRVFTRGKFTAIKASARSSNLRHESIPSQLPIVAIFLLEDVKTIPFEIIKMNLEYFAVVQAAAHCPSAVTFTQKYTMQSHLLMQSQLLSALIERKEDPCMLCQVSFRHGWICPSFELPSLCASGAYAESDECRHRCQQCRL
jgi:hypothetical protein